MNRTHTVMIAVIGLVTVALTVDHFVIRHRQQRLFGLENRLKLAESEALDAIEQTGERVADELATSTRERVSRQMDATFDERLAQFRAELYNLREEIDSERSRLSELRETNERAEAGLPELIELDDMNEYYGEKWNEEESLYATIETFQTSEGPLSFQKGDFDFQYVPSTHKLARVRIGKENSTIDPEIIKAWQADAELAKKKLGYRMISNNTTSTDDGQANEKHYIKGDMYFTTFFQNRVVQGMNDRSTAQYDFYIEVGSESRSETARFESYNQKLGS